MSGVRNEMRGEGRGPFTQKVPDGVFLDAVRAHAPATTAEIAEEVGCKRLAADYRLWRLADERCVRKTVVGSTLAWVPADE